MRIVGTSILFLFLNLSLFSQSNQVYHQDSLISWTRDLTDEVSAKHPGFYRYTTEERFDFLIDSTISTIDKPLNTLEYYRKIKPLFAQIGCLHTGLSLNPDLQKEIDSRTNLLPLEVFINYDSKVLVVDNYDDENQIPRGSEILSINGTSIDKVVSILLKSIPSDGYNTTLKTKLLNYRFAFWYRSQIEENSHFMVEFKKQDVINSITLTAVKSHNFPSQKELERDYEKPLAFEIKDGIGRLTIHTFSKSVIKSYNQNFKKFISNVFEQLEEQCIENLILDLRGNTGGSDPHAALLTSYFFDEEFSYWDRVEVTKATAEEIKGSVRLFYKKPIKQDSIYLWQKIWIAKDFDYYEKQQPAKNNFKGQTILLTDGFCMSSCADVTAILDYNEKAIIVGQETGGGYQGNTSGLMPSTELPMGLIVTMPLHKYVNAVDENKYHGHGTMPDEPVMYTYEELLSEQDLEMKRAMELIVNSN